MLSRTLLIVLICSSCQVNQFSKKRLIYDLFFERVEISQNVQTMVNVSFRLIKSGFPDITDKQLEEIKREVDIHALENEMESIYRKYYSVKDAKKAIIEIEKNGLKDFKEKPEMDQEIYDFGKKFTKGIIKTVKEKIKETEG